MDIKVWYSTESMADYIIDHTVLRHHNCRKMQLQESDAAKPKKFHGVPDHIKHILYLDAPDIIVEVDSNPIFTIEESKEAGTGHNAFQRFSRLAASAENGIPSFYIYPEAVLVERRKAPVKWDTINPLIFHALDRLMAVFNTPSLLFFFPGLYDGSDTIPVSRQNKGLKFARGIKYLACPQVDKEMMSLFECIDLVVERVEKGGAGNLQSLMGFGIIKARREWQQQYFHQHAGGKSADEMSPLSAVIDIPTEALLHYLKESGGVQEVQGILAERPKTSVYHANAAFRGDPYPGALAAIDYMRCRRGKTFEDRESNLVMAWGNFQYDADTQSIQLTGTPTIEDFCSKLRQIDRHNLLNQQYEEVKHRGEIPRYYMQARYGSMFSKAKDIRVYSYFCDAILFPDGVLWREG